MLRDGKYVQEEPPKIGAFYVPKFKKVTHTPEERFVQSVLLGYRERRASFFSKFLSFMLRV